MKLVIFVTTFVFILDQITKQIVTRSMEIGESLSVIPNFFYITYHRNAGAAFGILQGRMILFYIITAIAVIGIIVWLSKIDLKRERVLAVALALILGGALGNFSDRVIYQSVIDFFHTIWWGRPFAIFNIADAALTVGSVLLFIDVLFLEHKRSKDLYFKQ